MNRRKTDFEGPNPVAKLVSVWTEHPKPHGFGYTNAAAC
jgi:hypothetical protein